MTNFKACFSSDMLPSQMDDYYTLIWLMKKAKF